MSSTTQINIKLTRPPSGLTRKVTFEARPSWDELATRIESLFDIPKEHVAVSYVDSDNDEVTMNTQTELQDYYDTQSSSSSVATRFAVRDIRVASDATRSPSAFGESEGVASPAIQLADTLAQAVASISERNGAHPDVVDGIRNVVSMAAPFWQQGARGFSFGPYPPAPPPHFAPPPFGPHPGPWGFHEGGPEHAFGRGRGGRHRHRGPPGAHPHGGSPSPHPPRDEAAAPGAAEDAPGPHGRHRHHGGPPHMHGHRQHGPPPPPPSAFPAPPGAFPPLPPAPEEFVHVPAQSEDDPPSPGALPSPPPLPQGGDRPRTPGAADEPSGRRRGRGDGPGHHHHRHGPPSTPFDAFFGPDFARMIGFNPAQYSFGPGGPWGYGGGHHQGPPPHARASRASWNREEESSTEPSDGGR